MITNQEHINHQSIDVEDQQTQLGERNKLECLYLLNVSTLPVATENSSEIFYQIKTETSDKISTIDSIENNSNNYNFDCNVGTVYTPINNQPYCVNFNDDDNAVKFQSDYEENIDTKYALINYQESCVSNNTDIDNDNVKVQMDNNNINDQFYESEEFPACDNNIVIDHIENNTNENIETVYKSDHDQSFCNNINDIDNNINEQNDYDNIETVYVLENCQSSCNINNNNNNNNNDKEINIATNIENDNDNIQTMYVIEKYQSSCVNNNDITNGADIQNNFSNVNENETFCIKSESEHDPIHCNDKIEMDNNSKSIQSACANNVANDYTENENENTYNYIESAYESANFQSECDSNIDIDNEFFNDIIEYDANIENQEFTEDTNNDISENTNINCNKIKKEKRIAKSVINEKKLYICDVVGCNKSYKSDHSLIVHKRNHTDYKPYECTLCDKKFTTSYALTVHTRFHNDEKPYRCVLCSKGFKTSTDLERHRRVHTGAKPFKCTFDGCNKSFSTNTIQKRHFQIHTGDRPYQCNFENCLKIFRSPSNLINHKRVHDRMHPFECDMCEKSYTEYSSLYRHKISKKHINILNSNQLICPLCRNEYDKSTALIRHIKIDHNVELIDELKQFDVTE